MTTSTGILILVVAVALVTVAAGLLFGRWRQQSLDDFVTARGSLRGWTATATITASIMGGWILFSPAESATWAGLVAVLGYGIAQALPLFAFAVLGPRIRRLAPMGTGLGTFVFLRYGKAVHIIVLVFILFYLVVFLGAEAGAIARAVRLVSGIELLPIILIVGIATLIYTAYGGLRVSIFTDRLQFLLFIPLMLVLVVATITLLGGWEEAFKPVTENTPELLSLSHRQGLELGATFVIGVLAANLFHQGFWQRVYAASSDATIRWGFIISGVLVIILIAIGGLFGLWAVGRGLITEDAPAGIALFTLALQVLPTWALTVLIALVLILVMSSLDTLLNGISGTIVAELPRLKKTAAENNLLRYARAVTIVAMVPAILIGYFFDSVLYPFLIADLVCSAAAVPVFLGMYSKTFSNRGAIVSIGIGLLVGTLFFPGPSLAGWWQWNGLGQVWDVLVPGNLLAAFLLAVVTSALSSMGFLLWHRSRKSAY